MADDAAVTDLTEAVQIAERCSDDLPLVVLRMTFGTALTYRDSAGRERGVAMLAELRDTCIKERYRVEYGAAIGVVPSSDNCRRGY